ncbi:MAG: rhomboid family intramembrane serine protease, partial [Proteobacteria bacterium]|nr:rhomboid family intramembrane serine protease [Pseudomonadota bacterium]
MLSITNIIVLTTCLISIALMQNRAGKSAMVLHPATIKNSHQWYRFITSGFIHADFTHLAINMFVLWSFGNAVEQYLYPRHLDGLISLKYLALYFGGIVVSSIPSYMRHNQNVHYAALGASGGVSAVVFAVIIF